ncbi:MAG TPA: PhoU domain-containing protein [Sphingomonadaceae bacterium]|nr:PhoU domain-containing protein [Sphingomonadaceae bacterium]
MFRHEDRPTNITLTLLDLAGTVALLLWGVHMVQTGVQRIKRGVAFSKAGTADLVAQVDRLRDTLHQSTAVFLSGDIAAARALAAEKDAFRRLEDEATAAHFDRLRSGNIETVETSALHLDALRDLKRVSGHLIEASAYPVLKQHGALLPTRLRVAEP